MVDRNSPWFALYDKGVPYSCIYPPLSIKQMFNSCAEKNPERDYLIVGDTRLPYGLVNMMARKTANALTQLGVKKVDRVALMSPNGFNVYPREIDELMYTHPKVLQACSFGIPDPKRGESLKLALVLKPGAEMTSDEARAFCKESLSGYKVPTEVVFLDTLPVTAVGKPDRKKLRQMQLEVT